MLEELKKDFEMFHSSIQIKDFILLKNGETEWGVYKQALRELTSREQSIRSMYASIAKTKIDLEEIQDKLSRVAIPDKDSFQNRRLRIQEAELIYSIKDAEAALKDVEREFSIFYNVAIQLKQKLGEITKERRKQLDRDYWVTHTKLMIARDFRNQHHLSAETVKMIEAFSAVEKNEILNFLGPVMSGKEGALKKMLEWEAQTRNIQIDVETPTLPKETIKSLVENASDKSDS